MIIQINNSKSEKMALPAKSLSLKINFKKWQVFIFSKDIYTIVKYTKSFEKNLHKVLSSIKIFKLLQGLVGFGNLRFAEIKSCPSAYQTSELSEAELILDQFLTLFSTKIFPQRGWEAFLAIFPWPCLRHHAKNVIFDILAPSAFRKYSICLVFSEL